MKFSNWQLIKKFSEVKVLVIGELMLDVYLRGNSTRISPEAPVPVVNVIEELAYIGGAANVAANLQAMGAKVTFCSVCGRDAAAQRALKLLREKGIDTGSVYQDDERITLVKERVMAHDQILTRFDKGTETDLSGIASEHLTNCISEAYSDCDVVVIADYNKGILSEDVIRSLSILQQKKPLFLAIDSKYPDKFRQLHPTLVKPNYIEATRMLKIPAMDSDRIAQIKYFGKEICKITGAEITIVTVDEDGSLAFKEGNLLYKSAAQEVTNPNVVGAGDTFISAISLSLFCGAAISTAMELASAAASVSIKKEHTACCTDLELRSFFAFKNKYISSLQELEEICQIYRMQQKKIVFTNGCFDILHCGHVNYLKNSGQLGDILIVGINNDNSIRRIKGAGRPVNPLADRIEVITGLASVNHIISFGREEDDSPCDVIRVIKPDVFAKGGDYTRELLPEASLVESFGGVIRFLPFTPDHSTTGMIQRIRKMAQPAG